MGYKLGIDIGGTFTDFALYNEQTGDTAIHKQLTTPNEPSKSVLDGTRNVLANQKLEFRQVSTVVHGTTLVTNALIERKGCTTGMITTAGFRDVLDIAESTRHDSYDWHIRLQKPLISRDIMPAPMRYEVQERIDHYGKVLEPLDIGQVRAGLNNLLEKYQIESLAVCLLHSYQNSVHEKTIKDLIIDEYPDLYVSISAEIFPFMREYERFTTTSINAYVQPMVDRYLLMIEQGFKEQGFEGSLYIMGSNAGTLTPETARRFPVRIMESGPTAGALMASHYGDILNLPNILSYDTGGTTSKGALIRDGTLAKSYEMETAQVYEFKKGSGLVVRAPVVDMIEIGAGGGSISEVDDRGLLRVGPRSSGADPGPACYAQGGIAPTLTDADLILGYLDSEFFLGGAMTLDRQAAECSIEKFVGTPLALDLTAAAWGIHETINENCARAFRMHAAERMVDYRNCSMVAFGGSAPIRAVRIARKLKIPSVIVPLGAGVFSAFGLLISPLSFDLLRSNRVLLEDLSPNDFREEFASLANEALTFLTRAGLEETEVHLTRRLDMRYEGQGFEVEVALPDSNELDDIFDHLPEIFSEKYAQVFSMSFIEQPVEIVNWKVEAKGPNPELSEVSLYSNTNISTSKQKGHRMAYFPEHASYTECPVYNRYMLEPDDEFLGPAIIEENESTCVLGINDSVIVDEHRNLIIGIRDEKEN
jgi:N-methylhydantoinase A